MGISMKSIKYGLALGALICMVCLNGCQHYLVTSADSGKQYVTNNWKMGQNTYTGSLGFTDLTSGKYVVLQEYELEAITEQRAKAIGGALETE